MATAYNGRMDEPRRALVPRTSAIAKFTGAEIKAIRLSLGLVQRQMGTRLGVRANTYAQWECDIAAPGSSARLLIQIARDNPEGFLAVTAPFEEQLKPREKKDESQVADE